MAYILANTVSNHVVCYLTPFPCAFNYYIRVIVENLNLGTIVIRIRGWDQNALVLIPCFVDFFRLWVRCPFLYFSLLCNKVASPPYETGPWRAIDTVPSGT